MTHGPEHHIEHAEHAAHAAHDDFNKRVTMSIAIVAAALACVTMLGHRSHNETLRLQGESLALQTIASIKNTDTANKWAYYQSKNMFNLLSEITLDSLAVMNVREDEDKKKEYADITKRYEDTVAYYSGYKEHRVTDKRRKKPSEGTPPGRLEKEKEVAEKMDKEAKDLLELAKVKMDESHFEHEKAARLDYGELGLQFGVVLCSLAILTKSRGFWGFGLISAVIGFAVAMTGQFGLLMSHGHH